MIGFVASVGPCNRQPESLWSTIVNGGCAAMTPGVDHWVIVLSPPRLPVRRIAGRPAVPHDRRCLRSSPRFVGAAATATSGLLRSVRRICGRPTATSTVSAIGLRSPRRAITGRSGAQRSLSLRSSLSCRPGPNDEPSLGRPGTSRSDRDFVAYRREEGSRIEAETRARRIGIRTRKARVTVRIDDEPRLRASTLMRLQRKRP